jgi:hypothetical protein
VQAATQTKPLEQFPEQQAPALVQAPPLAVQAGRQMVKGEPGGVAQFPEQQSPLLVQMPRSAVQVAIAMQVPPEQFPEQHWAGLVQVLPLAVQQAPLTQF